MLLNLATLCALESSSFVEAVESVVEAVDCCRLLCALESSRFVKAVECVVLKMLIVVYIMCSRVLLKLKSVVEAVESVVEAVDCCS